MQVSILNPMADDADKVRTVLDTRAIELGMRWASVPADLEPRVFDRIQILHDVAYHRGQDHPSLCFHGDLEAVGPGCVYCKRRAA